MDSKTPTDMDAEIVMDTAMIMDNAMVPAPDTPMDDEPTSPEAQQPSKRRRKKSVVWEHFTVETIGPGHTRACCKQCKKSFAYINGPKLAGTSHLKRHIALGICPAGRQNGELSPYTPVASSGGYANATDPPKKRRYRITPPIPSPPLDHERCSQEVAKMIILHEYPLHIVEHPGFIDLVRTLQPQYNLVSFNTIQGDCVGIYLKEKQKLLDLISSIPGHVNLTLDVWTSNQTLGYVFLSGHFIDSDWKVHRHLLNVVMVSEPDSEHAFNQAVVACISDWCLDSGLFTLTVDETASSGSVMGNLRGLLCVKNPLVVNGQLVVGSCFARVLSRVAQEAIGSLQGTVNKIRDSVKYLKTSEANDEKFEELKQHLQVASTKEELSVDDRNKWNTTYNMLVAALELKEVFACFDASDPSYKLSPSMDDWKQVETLCSYLKLFYDAACTLTTAVPPTANIFFHEVSKIHLELAHAVMGQDPFVSNLVRPLHEKFDKYWRDSCLVLAIAVVMDPRFKMKLVEFNFQRIYGDDSEYWIRLVEDGIHELYQDYSSPMLTHHQQHQAEAAPSENEDDESIVKAEPAEMPPQEEEEEEEEEEMISAATAQAPAPAPAPAAAQEDEEEGTTLITFGDGLSDFDVYISEITSGQETRSELDQYLEESLLPRVQEFDVLGWWKLNNIKYPTLSKMAADVLSIPMCTVPPENVFDTKGRHIDSYRSSLRPVTLEALICTRDWLLHGSS